MATYIKIFIVSTVLIIILSACEDEYSPRPRGYFRIDLPQKDYQKFSDDCPFNFEYPIYSIIYPESEGTQKYWYNIDFPLFKARLHLSYKEVDNNISKLLEESRTLAFKHSVKANAIDEELLLFPDKNIYGVLYSIKGNTASSLQFFLTDSTEHFFRGALYFSLSPNNDSIAPVVNFIKDDVYNMINSFEWQN